jgi:hypothetical protein
LEYLLVVVTFHWDVTKLVYLERVLDAAGTYRTRVDVLIVTDQAQAVHSVLASWGFQADKRQDLTVWQAPNTAEEKKYKLLWAHRQAIADRLHVVGPNHYSAIFYMEDDTRLDWPAVVSWALDTEVLEPHNLTRCFYRTEVHATYGTPALLDWRAPLNLSAPGTVLRLDSGQSGTGPSFSRSHRTSATAQKAACESLFLRDGSPWDCSPHSVYLLPREPFQGMWTATRPQLTAFMAHPYWNETQAVDAKLPESYGYPERSNCMNLFFNVPAGMLSSCAVPVEVEGVHKLRRTRDRLALKSTRLPLVAYIEHMRNGYAATNSKHGKVLAEQALSM